MRHIVVIGSILLTFALLGSTPGIVVFEESSDSNVTNDDPSLETNPTGSKSPPAWQIRIFRNGTRRCWSGSRNRSLHSPRTERR